MLVTIITPTTHARKPFNEQLQQYINAQTYPIHEWLIDYSDDPIGVKRNNLVAQSTGDIIINCDSDDYYSPQWIELSVKHLIETNAAMTGLSSAYFKSDTNTYLWACPGTQPYVCEATMCYWRKTWERKPFGNINTGEGYNIQANNGLILPHNHIDHFTATIHGGNTASHKAILSMKVIK
jgi:glycosyltransferase involved in cell wall biosynthesis